MHNWIETGLHLAKQERIGGNLHAGLGGFQIILHHIKGQAVERARERRVDGLAIGGRIAVGGFPPAIQDRTRYQAAQRLRRGLLFESLNLVQTLAGGVVVTL